MVYANTSAAQQGLLMYDGGVIMKTFLHVIVHRLHQTVTDFHCEAAAFSLLALHTAKIIQTTVRAMTGQSNTTLVTVIISN